MKTLLVAFAITLCATSSSHAAEPVVARITLAARLTHDGAPVDGTVDLRLSLFPVDSGGTSLWSEDHSAVVATAGLASVTLGETQPLDTLILDGSARWLEIEVDGQRLSPRLAITSVPYALRAARAGQVGSLSEGDIQRRVSTACAVGQTIAAIGSDGSVTCSGYTGTSGVTISGSQIAADTSYVQRRVLSTCPAGQSIRAIAADGSVTCQLDSNTTYTPGTGLTLSATNQFSVDSSSFQRRVNSSCPVGQAIYAIDQNGNPFCASVSYGVTPNGGLALDVVNRQFHLGSQVVLTASSSSSTSVTDTATAAFCALSSISSQTIVTGTFRGCSLTLSNGTWTLAARSESGATVECGAICLR